MKLVTTIIFMSLLSILGFSKDRERKNIVSNLEQDSLPVISELQKDELYQLALDGIKYFEEDFIQNGSFLPFGFSVHNNKAFELIIYDEGSETETLLTDYVYEKIDRKVKEAIANDSVRITCLVYNGIINNDTHPNGDDCFSFLFRSKEFRNTVLISFPIKLENKKLMYGKPVIQIYK